MMGCKIKRITAQRHSDYESWHSKRETNSMLVNICAHMIRDVLLIGGEVFGAGKLVTSQVFAADQLGLAWADCRDWVRCSSLAASSVRPSLRRAWASAVRSRRR